MGFRLAFARDAERDLRAMPPADADGMLGALQQFAETGKGDIKKLKGAKGRWRLRWGKWRAFYTPDGRILRVLRVLDRKETYR